MQSQQRQKIQNNGIQIPKSEVELIKRSQRERAPKIIFSLGEGIGSPSDNTYEPLTH